jgi:hypothetical protein
MLWMLLTRLDLSEYCGPVFSSYKNVCFDALAPVVFVVTRQSSLVTSALGPIAISVIVGPTAEIYFYHYFVRPEVELAISFKPGFLDSDLLAIP